MTTHLDPLRYDSLFANPIFLTHANYVDCLRDLSQDITLKYRCEITRNMTSNTQLLQKVKLCNLTIKNLSEEMIAITNNREYAIVCTSWIPVKCYYVYFNLCLILKYLITDNLQALLSTTHSGLSKWLNSQLKVGDMQFSNDKFNRIYKADEINSWNFKCGRNLVLIDEGTRDKQIIKKLYSYAKDEYKRKGKIKSLRGIRNDEFIRCTEIALLDFFYWYRIKVNYRDLEFIDSSIHEDNFYSFYRSYFIYTSRITKAIRAEINRIAKIRIGTELFIDSDVKLINTSVSVV